MLERLKKLQMYLNGSESERFLDYYAARFFTGSVTFAEDEMIGTLYLDQGYVTRVEEGEPEGGVDLAMGLTKEMWDAFPTFKRSSVRAEHRFAGKPGFYIKMSEPIRWRQFNCMVAQILRIYSYIREDQPLYYDIPERNPEPVAFPYPVDSIRGFYLTVNGIKIYVETNDAPEDRPAIVCLHTAGRDNRQYHGVMQIVGDKYRLYAVDMPAHGKSWPLADKVPVISDYKTYGTWIWDCIAALGLERPVVIGCSMAGGIVYYIAQEYTPAAVICMQGTHNTAMDGGNMMEVMKHPGNNIAVTQREFSDALIGSKTPRSRVDFIRWGVETETSVVKYGDFSECNSFDVTEGMDRITCPVRIIQGLDDVGYTIEMARDSYNLLVNCKNKKLIELEGYGHFIIVENPEKVCEVIDELIASMEQEALDEKSIR